MNSMATKSFAVLGAVLMALVGTTTTVAADYSETERYVVVGDVVLPCGITLGLREIGRMVGADPGMEVNGACFPLFGNETAVDIRIEDATGMAVSGFYFFQGPGPDDKSGAFCGSVEDVSVPSDAFELRVVVDGPVNGALTCATETMAAGGTTGTVHVDFVSP